MGWIADPAWWGVMLTAIAMTGGGTAWLMQRRFDARAAMPIVRAAWVEGAEGCTCRIEIQNRLNEDLYICEARARGTFIRYETAYNPETGTVETTSETRYPARITLSETVAPHSPGRFSLALSGSCAAIRRSLKIRVSSSHRTLRSKWIKVITSQPSGPPATIPTAIAVKKDS
jgi:hypothetical protein